MYETLTWVKPDKSTIPILAEVREYRGDIEFETSSLLKLDDLIRRGAVVYKVIEVTGKPEDGKIVGPFNVWCKVNR